MTYVIKILFCIFLGGPCGQALKMCPPWGISTQEFSFWIFVSAPVVGTFFSVHHVVQLLHFTLPNSSTCSVLFLVESGRNRFLLCNDAKLYNKLVGHPDFKVVLRKWIPIWLPMSLEKPIFIEKSFLPAPKEPAKLSLAPEENHVPTFFCPVPVVGTFISQQHVLVLHAHTCRAIWGVCWYNWEFFCPKTMMPEKFTQPVATRVTKGRRFNEIAKVWTKMLTLNDETTCRDRCFLELCLICVNICEH